MQPSSSRLEDFKKLIKDVRVALRDFPQLNELIAGAENSDLQIAYAIKFVVDYFNNMPPVLDREVHWYEMPKSLLVLGTMGHLQRQVADLDERNTLPGSDGRVTFSTRQKGQYVKQSAYQKWQEFLSHAREYKIAMNYRSALAGGIVSSDQRADSVEDMIQFFGQEIPIE